LTDINKKRSHLERKDDIRFTKWYFILSPGIEEMWKTGGNMVLPVVNIGSAQISL
jgi:hypothetical protein